MPATLKMHLSERIFYGNQQERYARGSPSHFGRITSDLQQPELRAAPTWKWEEDVGYGTPGPRYRGSLASRRRLNVLPSLPSSTSVTGTDKPRATTVAKVNHTLQMNKSGTLQVSSDTGHRVCSTPAAWHLPRHSTHQLTGQ